MHLRVTKAPSEALALTNAVFVHPSDMSSVGQYVIFNGKYRFNVRADADVPPGQIGTSRFQRNWAVLALDEEVSVESFAVKNTANACADTITFQIDFMKKSDHSAVFDANELAEMFQAQFNLHVFSQGQVSLAVSNLSLIF